MEKAESGKAEKVVEIFKKVVSEEERGKIMSIADRIREEGIQVGEQRGIQLEKKHIACNMLAKGQSISLIAEVTGLAEDEVKKLQEEMQLQKPQQEGVLPKKH